MKWRDILGLVLLMTGVGGCMTGVRGLSGSDEMWWGAPAMGAGVVANALAYRVLRPKQGTGASQRTEQEGAAEPSDSASGPPS